MAERVGLGVHSALGELKRSIATLGYQLMTATSLPQMIQNTPKRKLKKTQALHKCSQLGVTTLPFEWSQVTLKNVTDMANMSLKIIGKLGQNKVNQVKFCRFCFV